MNVEHFEKKNVLNKVPRGGTSVFHNANKIFTNQKKCFSIFKMVLNVSCSTIYKRIMFVRTPVKICKKKKKTIGYPSEIPVKSRRPSTVARSPLDQGLVPSRSRRFDKFRLIRLIIWVDRCAGSLKSCDFSGKSTANPRRTINHRIQV